jgi:SmpA / OmlA family
VTSFAIAATALVGCLALPVGVSRLMLYSEPSRLPLSLALIGLWYAGVWALLRQFTSSWLRRCSDIALLLYGALFLGWAMYGPFAELPAAVTPAAIRAVTVGKTEEEVRAILGTPVETRRYGTTTLLIYARSHPFGPWAPRLWVELDDGRVTVAAGHLDPLLFDKRLVYLLRMDDTRSESPDFESTFRPWWRVGK